MLHTIYAAKFEQHILASMIYFLNSLPDHFFVMISKIDMFVLENLE
jgi:hypothetical protein